MHNNADFVVIRGIVKDKLLINDILISIADAAHNDSDTGVLDTLMYEHFNNIPRTDDYLYELKAYGLIEISPKASEENYGLVKITKKGL